MDFSVVELSPLHEEFLDRTRRIVLSSGSADIDVVGNMIAQHLLGLGRPDYSQKRDQL
jgi:hypothetical protein